MEWVHVALPHAASGERRSRAGGVGGEKVGVVGSGGDAQAGCSSDGGEEGPVFAAACAAEISLKGVRGQVGPPIFEPTDVLLLLCDLLFFTFERAARTYAIFETGRIFNNL